MSGQRMGTKKNDRILVSTTAVTTVSVSTNDIPVLQAVSSNDEQKINFLEEFRNSGKVIVEEDDGYLD